MNAKMASTFEVLCGTHEVEHDLARELSQAANGEIDKALIALSEIKLGHDKESVLERLRKSHLRL